MSTAEEAEVERFYEDLQNLLELTPQKDFLFIIGDWNAKVGTQEPPGVTGKFGLGIWNEAGQRLIEFCKETRSSDLRGLECKSKAVSQEIPGVTGKFGLGI